MTKSIKTTKIEHEKNLNLRKYKNALASLFRESENNQNHFKFDLCKVKVKHVEKS